jgi:hypothetical protein
MRRRRFRVDSGVVASYTVNKPAVAHARRLIEAHHYVLDSDWGEAQPKAADENAFLESHSWDEYAEWYLGLTEGASEDTKARYGFVYGDFRRVHRTGLIACQYRAAEWRHKEVELAAHDLLQHLEPEHGIAHPPEPRPGTAARPSERPKGLSATPARSRGS